MKILITSGGTKIPIDQVRDITNMSQGTFGSKIATELLHLGHEVYFFKAKGSKSPMSITLNFVRDNDIWKQLENVQKLYTSFVDKYKEMEYQTFDDYKERLERLVKIEQPNVIVLAAAVSDYGVENPFKGKVRSNDLLTIKLLQLPKIIYYIKEWCPKAKIVGFKLLVESKEYQLIDAAKRSISDNKCNMIVANDLADIKDGKHRVHLVFPTGEPITYKTDPNDRDYLARMVAKHIVRL